MPYHAYIDESGVNHNEIVMVVAMVILPGSRSAEKQRQDVLKELFVRSLQRTKAQQHKQLKKQELHFVDMKYSHKLIAGSAFSQANITCYVSYYWHQENLKSYKHRFKIYTRLTKNCIQRAFEHHKDLEVSIGKQGGWQAYEHDFLAELKLIPEHFFESGHFCKGKFKLVSAAHPGIQIADFYAGASRDFFRFGEDEYRAKPYEMIKRQVLFADSIND